MNQISSLSPRPNSRETWIILPILIVLLVGGYFRFTGLDWDANHHLHPDERFLTSVATALQPVYDPISYLKTSESTLNPYNANYGFYVYGNFPMTFVRMSAQVLTDFCSDFEDLCAYTYTAYDGVHLVGRFFSGFVDLVSVLFIFLIGRRLYDWRAGFLGALLLAMAVMPIQQSHFFTMDNWAAALTTVTMYMAVRASEAGERKRWWVLFGLFLGLSVASRINIAPLALMAGVAGLIWLARRSEGGNLWAYVQTVTGSVDLQRIVLGGLLAAFVSIVIFRLAQPYAFADSAIAAQESLEIGEEPSPIVVAIKGIVGFNPQFVSNMEEIQGQQSPEASFPPALQWTDRAPLLFPFTNMVLYGMGITAGLMAWAGFVWALMKVVRTRPGYLAHILPITWIALYFLFMGTRWVKSIRYFLPIYPFLLLLAGWALVELWKRANQDTIKRVAVGVLGTVVVGYTFLWANAFLQIYRQPITRMAASNWMFENVPTGATLLYETTEGEARELQLPLKGYTFQNGGLPVNLNFTLEEPGRVTAIRFNYLSDPDGTDDSETLIVNLNSPSGNTLASAEQTLLLGESEQEALIEFEATPVSANENFTIVALAGPGGDIKADTSRLVNEHWDDLLPVGTNGRNPYASYYTEVEGGQRPVTWPDNNAEKLGLMLAWIDEADYIALSSQRHIWSTARLPLTYPLQMKYYESLFNGELGFEMVAQFHADLHIGPLYISDTGGEIGWGAPPDIGWPPPGDLAAEEAFSVYDHPPVWIFKKTDNYDPVRVATLLASVDTSQVVVMNPGQATNAPNAMQLSDEAQAVQQSNGTFSEIFQIDGLLNQSLPLATVVWWLSVVALGWIFFPIAYTVFRGLPTRGYALSRILSLLLLSYFGWILASLDILPNTRGVLFLGLLLFLILSLWLFVRQAEAITKFVRSHLSYIATVEIVAVALFGISLLIRLGNPDVWDVIWGGEKPMDLSYFNAVLKSTTFPPYDPWYAGGYINYYYYGFVYVGSLTKLLGIVPTTAYNLIIPMLFSFTGLGVFSLAYNVVAGLAERVNGVATNFKARALMAGFTAMVLCVLLGNLAEVGVMLNAWERTSDSTVDTGLAGLDRIVRMADGAADIVLTDRTASIGTGDWFWTATRAININPGETAPITEFPFFTFLYADLHAHMIALPLAILALGWAISVVMTRREGNLEGLGDLPGLSGRGLATVQTVLLWFVGSVAIGVLRPANTWDWPTYLFLGMLAVAYSAYVTHERVSWQMLAQAGLQVVLLAGLSALTFLPYISNYGTGYESIGLWPGSYTNLTNYLSIYGLFLFLIVTYLLREIRAWTQSWTEEGLVRWQKYARPVFVALIFYPFIVLFLMTRGYWIAPLVLTLIVVSGLLGLRPGISSARRVPLILTSSALGLTLMVEIIVLEGDIGRMNTVFKFYMQVWVMLSIVGGVAMATIWPALRREWGARKRVIWQGALALLIAAAATYPVLATRAKWQTRMSREAPITLDGTAFMEVTSYGDTAADGSPQNIPLAYEASAIEWMQRNIEGSPVIVEAHGGNPYRSIQARVAMYTGLPTIIGWDWHQRQQRASVPDSLVWSRVNDVTALFNTTDADEALRILDKYSVKYVYAGQLEWTYYSPQGMQKFDRMVEMGYLVEVFRNEGVSIYEVVQ